MSDRGRMQKRELPCQSPSPLSLCCRWCSFPTPGCIWANLPQEQREALDRAHPLFEFKNAGAWRGMCSFSQSSDWKDAEWINGLKWLIQKLGLGLFRRRSFNVFSLNKMLKKQLKDQLEWKQKCLKFFKYVYIYIHMYRGKKEERENSDLNFFLYALGILILFQLFICFVIKLLLAFFLIYFSFSSDISGVRMWLSPLPSSLRLTQNLEVP